ncbi:MAG: helix-turn-helix domain-containing protein [Acidobacteriota bacterium]
MDRQDYTIREAAEVTGVSATTIRRYIKAGRVHASLAKGRYGPEYRVSVESLKGSGLEQSNNLSVRKNRNQNGHSIEDLSALLKDLVPASLFQELIMKHEQLLVQYGMVRASGKRLIELKAESEMNEQIFHEQMERMKATLKKYQDEIEFLKKHLRLAELEMEEKNSKIRELKDRINLLELVSRNAITTENIERQFMEIYSKQEKIKQMTRTLNPPEKDLPQKGTREKHNADH